MRGDSMRELVSGWLEALCTRYPDRHMGGPGNRAANELFAEVVAARGFEVEQLPFECYEWQHGGASIAVGDVQLPLHPGPYSPPFDGQGTLLAASSIGELEALAASEAGAILLLHGPLVAEQLFPSAYPFVSWPEHQAVYAAIAAARPASVIAATGRNWGMAGSLYPFPFINDGNFGTPSAYLKDVDGAPLLEHVGENARVVIDSRRSLARSVQMVARRAGSGSDGGRLVVTAHIDSVEGSPGALDNGTGVAVLLAVAELLSDSRPALTIELVPFNGEDDYSAAGQVRWLAENEGRMGDIVADVNIDAAAWRGHGTYVSTYAADAAFDARVDDAIAVRPGFSRGPQWPQGDHSIFAMQGTAAVAVTCDDIQALETEIAHTSRDALGLADPDIVVEVARFVTDLADRLA